MTASVRYTQPIDPAEPDAPRMGVMTLDGVSWSTILPPESGEIRPAYDAFLEAGGVPEEYVAPQVPVPDQQTLSDWRVGLIMNGRFDEVEARVIAARDGGTVEGKIAWQRFEYANHVYRAELMQLKDVFGFTEAEVDDSMRWADAVRAASGV